MVIGISGKIDSGKDTIGDIIRYLKYVEYYDLKDYSYETYREDITEYTPDNFQIKKFADTLKDIVCLLIGCTREQLEDRKFKEKELGESWRVYKVIHQDYDFDFNKVFSTQKEAKQFIILMGIETEILKETLTPRKLLQLLGTDCGRDIIHPDIWVNALMSKYRPISDISTSNTFSDNRLVHGYKNTKIWKAYYNIKQRCNNEKHPRFKDYGGKDIKMCKEWEDDILKFINWAISNGYNEKLTIDRIDVLKGYAPNNCRCVSYSTQAINTNTRKDNKTGYRGVSYEKSNNNRIRASIQVNKKIKFLGYFDTLEEASEAYELAFLEREGLYKKQEKSNLIYPNFIITDMRFPNELKAVQDRGITIRVNREKLPMEGGRYSIKSKFDKKIVEDVTAHKDIRGYDKLIFVGNDGLIYRVAEWSIFETNEHPSETALDNTKFDYVIDNNQGIEELVKKVKNILIKEKII